LKDLALRSILPSRPAGNSDRHLGKVSNNFTWDPVARPKVLPCHFAGVASVNNKIVYAGVWALEKFPVFLLSWLCLVLNLTDKPTTKLHD
jgi:hypothetical protein